MSIAPPAHARHAPQIAAGKNLAKKDEGAGATDRSFLRGHDYASASAMLSPVQRRGEGRGGATDVHAAAERGTRGSGGAIPHGDRIQAAFGRHDVSGIRAHGGAQAAEASRAMGAEAFAAGDSVAFGSSPDLHTAAHEAAHVVQQRAGVSVGGGVGQAGDRYEQHADAVADAVVAGRSAEGLLDAHAGSAGRSQATGDGPVQMKLAMTEDDLKGPLQHNDPLEFRFNAIAVLLEQYNEICDDDDEDLTESERIQQQLDKLRALDRACYGALDAITVTQRTLLDDERGKILHVLLQQSSAEHVDLIAQVTSDDELSDEVDPFAPVTDDDDDLTAGEAKTLWANVMAGHGQIKLLGSDDYQGLVKSWLTKLMDTKQGRRLLRYLDKGDDTDVQKNVYIGELISQLPQGVTLAPNKYGKLGDQTESVAQPLTDAKTQVTPSNTRKKRRTVNDAEGVVDTVLDDKRGFKLNGQKHGFNEGSGSFTAMKGIGTMRAVSGQERNNNNGDLETPELYQPDWILLGHELGHAANMKKGATTDGRVGMDNDTDRYSSELTGVNDRKTRQDQWYGGSEEYINIVGNENRLRDQGGLGERFSHTSPNGREMYRLMPQIEQGIDEGTWRPRIHVKVPAELQKWNWYLQQKQQLMTTVTTAPYTPGLVLQAQQLGQQMVTFFDQQDLIRQQTRTQLANTIDEPSWLPQLQLGRPADALLQQQHIKARTHMNGLVDDDPAGVVAAQIAQELHDFGTAWVAMTTAHDQAGLGKQVRYKAWWEKAKDSVHNIGDAIIARDNTKYQRKLDRVNELTNDYS